MKRSLAIFLLFLCGCSDPIGAQPNNTKQLDVATKFISYVMHGQNEKSWALFDRQTNADVSRHQFDSAMAIMKKGLVLYDTVELVGSGGKVTGNLQLDLYTFKPISIHKKVVDDVSVDVVFVKSSYLVAGMQPKIMLKENSANTTTAKETPLEKASKITIGDKSYDINGINIVHFSNQEAILAIQISITLPPDGEAKGVFAKKEALKFANYLVKNGYMEKARSKATEIGRKLLGDIGVSFLDPIAGAGYNVMVTASELQP